MGGLWRYTKRMDVPDHNQASYSQTAGNQAWHGAGGRHFMLLSQPLQPVQSVVLIVLPPGPELSRTYRLLREVTQQLVARGCAVLRLELTGTGNSEWALDETSLDHWVDDIGQAWAALDQRFPGVRQQALGVRYSVRLLQDEALASGRSIELTALCPVLCGADWLEELRGITVAMSATGLALDEADLAGERCSVGLLTALAEQSSGALCGHNAILEVDSRYIGLIQEYQLLEDISSNLWMVDDLPLISSTTLQRALLTALCDTPTRHVRGDPRPKPRVTTKIVSPANRTSCTQEPVYLASQQLAGSPAEQAMAQAVPVGSGLFMLHTGGHSACPPVVLLNSGLIPQHGPYRLYVEMAQALAALGIPSLRLDESGKGESARKALPRAEALQDDFAQVMDFLRSRGHSEVILAGICSGADAALTLAAADERVVGLILLDGFAPRTIGFYARFLRERLMSGQRVWAFLQRQFNRASGPSEEPASGLEIRDWEASETMSTRYRALLARDCATCAVFTGALRHDYYNGAGQLASALGNPHQLTEVWYPAMSHLYPATSQRAVLISGVVDWLSNRWLPTE